MSGIERVLSHPLRHRLLFEYRRPANPAAIARRIGAPLNLISYHTRRLARARMVELVRTERRRGGVAHFYRSTVGTRIEDEEWSAVSPALRRRLVLDALALAIEDARRGARDGGFERPEAHLSRLPLELDEQGVDAAARCLRGALDELERINEASRERGGPASPFEIVMLGFEPAQPQERQSAPVSFAWVE